MMTEGKVSWKPACNTYVPSYPDVGKMSPNRSRSTKFALLTLDSGRALGQFVPQPRNSPPGATMFRRFHLSRQRGFESISMLLFAAGSVFLAQFGVCQPKCLAQDSAAPGWLQQAQAELIDVIARAEQSVVSIALIRDTTTVGPLIDPFHFDSANTPEAPGFVPFEFGSGVIISREGIADERFVLTNYHVVHGTRQPGTPAVPARLMIRLPSRHVVWANEVAADPRSDLSVLSLDLADAGLAAEEVMPFEFRDAPPPRKGQLVISLGNPYAIARDGSASASVGIISNIDRRSSPSRRIPQGRRENLVHEYGTLLTIDTRLQFGGSGGALVDLEGRLIGLTTSLAALEGYESSAGFAIPLDEGFRRIVESLLAGHEVEYGFLGVATRDVLQEETTQWQQVRQPSAACADHVAGDSPAHRGGLRAGDIILAVNDSTVYGVDDLTQAVGLLGPESTASLSIFRPSTSQELTVEVRLGKSPVLDDSGIVATARRWPLWRGLGVDYSTGRRQFMPFDVLLTYRKAVLINEVVPGSPADQAGMKVGDMIAVVSNMPVETPHEFHRMVQEIDDTIQIELLDGRRIALPPPTETE